MLTVLRLLIRNPTKISCFIKNIIQYFIIRNKWKI